MTSAEYGMVLARRTLYAARPHMKDDGLRTCRRCHERFWKPTMRRVYRSNGDYTLMCNDCFNERVPQWMKVGSV